MKLILLFYLEEDGPAVTALLSREGVTAYSRLPVEGRGGPGGGGWLEGITPHRSKVLMAVVPDEQADRLRAAVESAASHDPDHPIHAAQIDLEAWVHSGS